MFLFCYLFQAYSFRVFFDLGLPIYKQAFDVKCFGLN